MLADLMKKYNKTWQYLFNTYQNSSYKDKLNVDFDIMNQRKGQLMLPEVVMMLKDYGILP